MLTQELRQGSSLVNMSHHPKRVAEHTTIVIGREREIICVVLGAEQLEKLLHFLLMHKTSFCSFRHLGIVCLGVAGPCAQKLVEGEYSVMIYYILDVAGDVVGENLHLRQFGVRVGLIGMLNAPFELCLLLRDIVPSEDFFFLEVFIQVERSAGEVKHLCLFLLQKLINNALAKGSACSLVCLVDNHQVPVGVEDVCLQLLILLCRIMTT